jgi:anti-anti-sigma regulatory factor
MDSVTATMDNTVLTITLQQGFDHRYINDFIQCYQDTPEASAYYVDLRHATQLDSSTLGMFLLMRNAIASQKPIHITNASLGIKKILVASRFEKKFSIE